jgi:hypothetical protein
MGVAVDTVGFYRTSGGAADTTPQPATVVSGDSLTVRSFPSSGRAMMQDIFYDGTALLDLVRLRSPMFHDNVRGIYFIPNSANEHFKMPRIQAQPLISQDTLAAELLVGTATTSAVCAFSAYYTDLSGAAARLYLPGDVFGIISCVKTMEVDVAQGATPGVWVDTAITTTEDILHANRDYAILGYYVDRACSCVGIKGIETANLRVCGPGLIDSKVTTNYFVSRSEDMQIPEIPVINSANKDSLYATVLSDGSATTVKVQFIMGELGQNLSA